MNREQLEAFSHQTDAEPVLLKLWKTLFPEAGIHIQTDDGKRRFLDSEGKEYFLFCGEKRPAKDNGAFLPDIH